MKRLIEIGGLQGTLDFSLAHGSVRYTWQQDGMPAIEGTAEIVAVAPGVYSLLRGDTSVLVRISAGQSGWQVSAGGASFDIAVTDPRETARRRAAADQNGPVKITVPIPGKVVRLLVAAGDTVEAGQGVVVVEAMKMQNEVKAPRGGVIESMNVNAGTAVSPGDVLAIIGNGP